MWWDLLNSAKYEVPKGGGVHALYAGSLWMGGVDVNNQLKVAAIRYRQVGYDFWPGPLNTTTAEIDPTTCSDFDKFFKMTRTEVDQFVAWCVEPTARIVRELRAQAPGLKIICFPREAGSKLKSFVAGVDADCLALGTAEDVGVVRSQLGSNVTLQGNLDPLALVAGGVALEDSVRRVRGAFEGAPYIFNLGHGILPETPIAHVERLIELVRAD